MIRNRRDGGPRVIRLLVIGGFLGQAWAVQAQVVDLKGRVLDKVGNKPVSGATVKLANSTLATTTDTAGRFSLKGTATSLEGNGTGWAAAPFIKNGEVHIQGASGCRNVRVEIFGMGGASLGAVDHGLADGWNRIRLPAFGKDFLGFARITAGSGTWVKRILHASGRVQAGEDASFAAPLAKAAVGMSAAGTLEVSADRLVAKKVPFDKDVADLGDIVLDYPARRLDVGAPPIYGAHVLFDGSKGKAAAQAELLAKWQDWPRFTPSPIMFKIAKDPEFPNDTNRATVQSCCNTNWGMDDIQARQAHGDAQLHVEWIAMGEYDNTENPNLDDGKGYVNSGVYVQSRYEVQINSWTTNPSSIPGNHDMGSLVDDFSPTANANRPNGKWQAYDITFRSARYNAAGARTENARMTIWWNGVLVHDNRDAKAPATGTAPGTHSGEDLTPILYGLKLQSEGRDVRFRNIWTKDLAIDQAETRFGY